MATTVTVRRVGKFENQVEVGNHLLAADEPVEAGGSDRGPDPYGYLLSALGACISMTLTMYAERKGWPLTGVKVVLHHEKVHVRDCEDCAEGASRLLDRIEKRLTLEGELDGAQIQRLEEIATKCPVHKTLTGDVEIVDAS